VSWYITETARVSRRAETEASTGPMLSGHSASVRGAANRSARYDSRGVLRRSGTKMSNTLPVAGGGADWVTQIARL